MTCAQFDQLLDPYLDGAMDPPSQRAMDDHLAGCAACRTAVADMRLVLAGAAALPKNITPPRSLWPAISGRLAPRGSVRPARAIAWRRWAPLAAAALLLVTVTAVVTHRIATRPTSTATAPSSTTPVVMGFAADREYVLAAEDLERVLAEGRDNLSPATVTVLERNLALIDAAIAEARAALEADPVNADLRSLLLGAHRQKLDLLDRATRLTRS